VKSAKTATRQPTPVPPATARALKLWVVLAKAHNAIAQHVEADVKRHGLTTAEFGILEALWSKGPLLLGEVQKKILVSSGGVTFLVDKLADRGLVERKPCPSDRRARYASLTDEGEALMEAIFPDHATAIRDALAGLSAADQLETTRLLKVLGLAASGATEPGPADE
jgi:MarR family 2-MHQ and catechol resistance regulon transcriptional repressor